MGLLVPRETGRVHKCFVAGCAFIVLLRGMRLLVVVEVGQAGKGLSTVGAVELVLPLVHLLVPGQTGGVAETLVALLAGKQALLVLGRGRSLGGPGPLVLLAEGVEVGLVPGTQLEADLQVGGLSEVVCALGVVGQELPDVSDLMFGERRRRLEGHLALSAGVELLPALMLRLALQLLPLLLLLQLLLLLLAFLGAGAGVGRLADMTHVLEDTGDTLAFFVDEPVPG